MNRFFRFAAALALAALPLLAGQTRNWTQADFSDFEKGVIRNLSLRSDGVLALAPASHEMLDTSSPYLWALARDSKGNLYAGGGTGAKLHQVAPGGKSKVIAELEGLEIHAIAIDKQDRVYAATSPDGKVWRVAAGGKPEVFFDPAAKYIWTMAFDTGGNLFIATGDQGEIYRVPPDGKGKVFFKSEETHVRSMAIDPKGNVIAGTEPGGLVMRVSPSGEGFVLYQMRKKEVTAVAVAADGAIYAAAVGTKQPQSLLPGSSVSPPPAQIAITGQGAGTASSSSRISVAPPPPSMAPLQAVVGGSDVYRIEPGGNPRRVWTHPSEVVYAIALDAQGRALLGAGNKGHVFRIESPARHTLLLSLPCTQITAFLGGEGGRIYAATGNVGKVYEIGPGLEREGTIESDVFDSGMFSAWGRLSFDGKLNGGQVAVATRTGNHDQPQKNWSPWSKAIGALNGERMASPAARFVQWRAMLSAAGSGQSPELEMVDVAYLPRNVEPRVDEVRITPANYKFPNPTPPSSAAPTLSLPPLGRQSSSSLSLDSGSSSSPTMTYARGFMSARWLAVDPNGDGLIYTVEIRGATETAWKPLKKSVREKHCSWDSTAFPDGEYRLRVTASDAPDNPPADALIGQLEGDPFYIDNTPPRIANLTAARSGNRIEVGWHAADALNNLKKAEFSLDGGEWTVVNPVGGISDSLELDYRVSIDAAGAGEHTVAVRVEDDYDNLAVEKVVVK